MKEKKIIYTSTLSTLSKRFKNNRKKKKNHLNSYKSLIIIYIYIYIHYIIYLSFFIDFHLYIIKNKHLYSEQVIPSDLRRLAQIQITGQLIYKLDTYILGSILNKSH